MVVDLMTATSFAKFLTIIVAASGSVADVSQDVDVGYNLFTKSAEATNRTCFDVPQLPAATKGVFLIGGPGQFEMGGYSFNSFFDGYARINRFELDGSKACYTAKFVNTSFRFTAEKLGRIANGITFLGVDPKLPPCPRTSPTCFIGGSQLDNNWVNFMPMQAHPGHHEGLLLTDSQKMLHFDYDTMESDGVYPFEGGSKPPWLEGDHVSTSGSAHPSLRPGTTNIYVDVLTEMNLAPLGHNAIAVYTVNVKTMERALLKHVKTTAIMYTHSFGVTKNFVVLPLNMQFTTGGHMWSGHLLDAFSSAWDGIKVVDLSGQIQEFQTEPFYHVHVVNTFENETGIVMDLGTYQYLPFREQFLATAAFRNKTERDTHNHGSSVERMHLHLAGPLQGQVTRQVISIPNRLNDFFQINKLFHGLPYCIMYMIQWFHDGMAKASMAIEKLNTCTGKRTYWHKKNVYPTEPKFIPSGTEADAEDFGHLVFVALNGPRAASDLVVLNASTFEEIAVVELPGHIPFLGHGQFLPADARDAIKEAAASGTPDEVMPVVDKFLLI